MASNETRAMVLTAAAVCEEKKGTDTRILELDPLDSGFTDFFLITSGANTRQTEAIADEIEHRLKSEYGVYASSVEGRRVGEWILLDYFDFVVHIFLEEKRAFYDIERLRKSAQKLDPEKIKDQLKAALTKKTLAARSKSTAKKAPAKKAAAKKSLAAKKTEQKKTPVAAKKSSPASKSPRKTAAKKSPAKKTASRAKK
jgi:ribosome-associated protein